MKKVSFHNFDSEYVDSIHRIYAYYVENSVVTFDINAPTKREIEEKFLTIAEKKHPIIIAKIDSKIVGFAYASTYRPRPAYRFSCENAIYIDKNMLRQKIGSFLLAELIERAKQFGFKQMIAIITKGTESSIALHKKFGFVIRGEFPKLGYKFGKWHDIVHMQREL